MCAGACMCAGVHAHVYMWRPEGSLGCYSSDTIIRLVLREGLSLDSQGAPEICLSLPPLYRLLLPLFPSYHSIFPGRHCTPRHVSGHPTCWWLGIELMFRASVSYQSPCMFAPPTPYQFHFSLCRADELCLPLQFTDTLPQWFRDSSRD